MCARCVNENAPFACVEGGLRWPLLSVVHQQKLQLTIAWFWRNFTGLASSTQQVDVEHRNTFASRYIDCSLNFLVGFLRLWWVSEMFVLGKRCLRCTHLALQPPVSISLCCRVRNELYFHRRKQHRKFGYTDFPLRCLKEVWKRKVDDLWIGCGSRQKVFKAALDYCSMWKIKGEVEKLLKCYYY